MTYFRARSSESLICATPTGYLPTCVVAGMRVIDTESAGKLIDLEAVGEETFSDNNDGTLTPLYGHPCREARGSACKFMEDCFPDED